jgi:predicted transcriptional regulator
MAKNEKRGAAKDLYLTGQYNQGRISAMLGVTPNTISKWAKEDDWEDEYDKVIRITESTETRIRELIDYNLMVLQARVKVRKESLENGDVESAAELELIDGKQTDGLSKLFAQIKRKDLTNADKIQIIDEFLKYIESKDLSFAKEIIVFTDGFRDKILNVK